jgi:hypothetical protein
VIKKVIKSFIQPAPGRYVLLSLHVDCFFHACRLAGPGYVLKENIVLCQKLCLKVAAKSAYTSVRKNKSYFPIGLGALYSSGIFCAKLNVNILTFL